MHGTLANLALISSATSHRSSSWDRTGGNADCVYDIAPGKTVTLLQADGPGRVTHVWMTFMEYPGHATVLRDMVLRMWWDDADVPCVEVPMGDFFGLGHALPPTLYWKRKFNLSAAPICVGLNERSLNSYWPMPFQKCARIELYNNGDRSLRQLYYHVDYELGPQDSSSGLFHAVFHKNNDLPSQPCFNLEGKDNYILLETEGRGHYAGCFLYVDNRREGWFGEGDDMIFIDHDPMPTINGTGTEDYFNNAWCYNQPFAYPYYGCPLIEKRSDGGFYTLYRFHVPDPVRFSKHIKVTFEHVWGEVLHTVGDWTNGYSSVAFWYQEQPIRNRMPLPAGAANHPLLYPELEENAAADPLDLPAMEIDMRRRGLTVDTVFCIGQEWLRGGGGLRIKTGGGDIEIPVEVPADGVYRLEVKPIYGFIKKAISLSLKGSAPVIVKGEKLMRESDGAFVILGNARSQNRHLTLVAGGEEIVALDLHRIKRLD